MGWSSRSLFLCGLSIGFLWAITFFRTYPPALAGVFHRLSVIICSKGVLHEVQEDNLCHHCPPRGLQGNLCSGTWGISSPSFFPNLDFFGIVYHIFSLFSSLLCRGLYPFLNKLSLRCCHLGYWVQPSPAVGLLQLAGTSCVQHKAVLASPHR